MCRNVWPKMALNRLLHDQMTLHLTKKMKENVKLGLKENWAQFTILVVVNAFVGGMVGLERTIFPKFAEIEFGVASKTAILSFIIAFGVTKAITNYFTGKLANKFGRKNLLLLGWLFAIPIPFILINATSWNWVIYANILLGINQGLTWSSTVVMKIDLVGQKDRGLAMGINEFAGYFAVGVVAFLTGVIAQKYGVTPYPFYLGIGISIIGLLLTLFFVRDTRKFVNKEQKTTEKDKLENVFLEIFYNNILLNNQIILCIQYLLCCTSTKYMRLLYPLPLRQLSEGVHIHCL